VGSFPKDAPTSRALRILPQKSCMCCSLTNQSERKREKTARRRAKKQLTRFSDPQACNQPFCTSQNHSHRGWKRPLRSSGPTISPSPPCPQNQVPLCDVGPCSQHRSATSHASEAAARLPCSTGHSACCWPNQRETVGFFHSTSHMLGYTLP